MGNRMNQRTPVLVGIALSPTFAPALDKAAGILRRKNPHQDDAELLEQILIAGICQIIDNNPSNIK